MFISVVIPTFNQRFDLLERALKSAFSQFGQFSFEVLVVDDGSKELVSTQNLCLQYGAKFFSLSHAGAAKARNKGLREAHGDFISFLDSDDYLSPQFFQMANDALTGETADLIMFGHTSGPFISYTFEKTGAYTLTDRSSIRALLDPVHGNSFGLETRAPWSKVFRRSFLLENNLFFPETMEKQGEDVIWLMTMMEKASKVICYPQFQLYHYEASPNSVTVSYDPNNVRHFGVLIDAWKDYLARFHPGKEREQLFSYLLACEFPELLLKLVFCNRLNPKSRKTRYREAKVLFFAKDSPYRAGIHQTRLSYCPTLLKKMNLLALKMRFFKLVFNHYERKCRSVNGPAK